MENLPFDPNDIEAVRRWLAELEAAKQNLTTTSTQGGAYFAGEVHAARDVIGGDYINIINQVTRVGEDPEEAKSVIASYLQALSADLAGLKLGEIDETVDKTQKTPLQLADVYVPLDTTVLIPQEYSLQYFLNYSHRRGDMGHSRETRPVSALEALAVHRELTVLGKPGSGKSTFGSSVLLTLAQVWLGHDDQLSALGETWTQLAPLPVRVVLRRFAEQLGKGDKPARAGDLWKFIAHELKDSGFGLSQRTIEYIQRIARQSGVLILLDGLDECGNAESRQRVMAAVDELIGSSGQQCRFILTARPYAWPAGPDPDRGVYALVDLDQGQIEQFIRAWYDALVKRKWLNPGEAVRKRDDLLTARNRPDLMPLARNPLLLTLLSILHSNKGHLPDDRADLYNASVELLMLRWNSHIGADKALLDELNVDGLKLSNLREVLEELAFEVHGQNVGQDGTADIGEDRLIRAFRPLLGSRDKAAVVVEYIEKRAGLLLGQGEKDGERQFTFPHRTFQEFLAACHLQKQNDFPGECARLARVAPSHWQVVLPLAARLAQAGRGASAADELIGRDSVDEFRRQQTPKAEDWHCALIAGLQLLEIGKVSIRQRNSTRAIANRVAGWLAASLSIHPEMGGMEAGLRTQAGDVLAELGDPRFDPQRFYLPKEDMLGFVHIPADPNFIIGTLPKDFDRVMEAVGASQNNRVFSKAEINDQPTPTHEFFIARYPVTVAQFRAFVEATGFKLGREDALRDPESCPVRYVSWNEALEYCRWLNGVLQTSTELASCELVEKVRSGHWQVTLPSELEWEKAARGGLVGAVFPWGDTPDPNRANYADSNIGNTSAVGCFPPNAYRLYDMIGNVWEWTRSLWGKDWDKPEFGYPYQPDDPKREDLRAGNGMLRVVRGGSWSYNRDDLRCAVRLGDLPGFCLNFNGFRVVVVYSAPVV